MINKNLTIRVVSVVDLLLNNSSNLSRRFVLREQIFLRQVRKVSVLLRKFHLDLRVLYVDLLRFSHQVVVRSSVGSLEGG